MTQKQAGLRFLLTHGHFLSVVLPQAEAEDIIKKWNERFYHIKNSETITGKCHLSNTIWTVEVADIRAIHTYALEPINPPRPGSTFPGRSGVN